MKIERINLDRPTKLFSSLETGDVFLRGRDIVAMKMDTSGCYNAVDLDDGTTTEMDYGAKVVVLDKAKVITGE